MNIDSLSIQMKQKVEQCTNVPVEQQVWTNLHGIQDHVEKRNFSFEIFQFLTFSFLKAQLSESRINNQSKLVVREQRTTTVSRDIKVLIASLFLFVFIDRFFFLFFSEQLFEVTPMMNQC